MSGIPEEDLAETRAALAPTLDATAAILPWVVKPRKNRFPAKLNERWIAANAELASIWSERHKQGLEAFRPAVFTLYSLALETADPDCLLLGEALAEAADKLEDAPPSPRLSAALSSTIESLIDSAGLEHDALSERARHFAHRLSDAVRSDANDARSAILDHLFQQEAQEHLDSLRDALAALPPDAYALTCEAETLVHQAEQAELWGVMHQARELAAMIRSRLTTLDVAENHAAIAAQIEAIGQMLSGLPE